MKLTSPVFSNDQFIPSKYTCDGENINPELNISGIPSGAKSLVLIMDDPDASMPLSTGAPAGTWTHWTVWNINPKTVNLAERNVPKNAVEGVTSFGKTGYSGPCPHKGTHHYEFKLYALDAKLDLVLSSKKADLEWATQGHILDQAVLVGLYKRG